MDGGYPKFRRLIVGKVDGARLFGTHDGDSLKSAGR
jgi:hypothetical protein